MVVRRRQSKISDVAFYGARAKGKGSSVLLRTSVSYLLLLSFAMLLSVISFWGNNWLKVQFIPGNISKSKIVAEIPFEYVSTIKTDRLYEQKKHQSSNVFSIDERSYDGFISALKLLDEQMEVFTYENTLTEVGREEIREFVNEFTASNTIKLEWQDIALLISSLSPIERAQVFQECIAVLREIAKDGVFSDENSPDGESLRTASYLGLKLKDGHRRNIRTVEWALHYARMHLMSMDIDHDIVTILFNILKQGIKQNLVYDVDASKAKFDLLLKSMKPVRVKVKQGDVLLETNTVINAESYEILAAYQKALKSANYIDFGFNKDFYPKSFLGFVTLLVVAVFVKLLPKRRRLSRSLLIKCGILIVFQLIALRLCMQIGEADVLSRQHSILCALHLFPPALCASGIAMLLYGSGCAFLVTFVVSVFYTLMASKGIEFFTLLLAINLIFLKCIKHVNYRIKIVRAGCVTGATAAVMIFAKNFFVGTAVDVLICQSVCALLMGVLSGLFTAALFSIFERLFSAYSNITLLELTDYNHPILKNLQMAAPGTYNHSLLVSNIAEQVAIQVNANPVLCKTGALYHDIGKMLKAEYFIENQNNQVNLHDQQTPYISTLVIKNHVKDGVDIAKEYRLPPSIIDFIQQHHGTTLIHFFYQKAKKELLEEFDTNDMTREEMDSLIASRIDSAAFRYDGPRPRSKELLIVMLADSIEAASRSMKRITHQAIENLVNTIFDIKLRDHQLDECPITFEEIRDMKKAFALTVLSMMHSRISYSLNGSSTGKK